jgi:hypothetical protein
MDDGDSIYMAVHRSWWEQVNTHEAQLTWGTCEAHLAGQRVCAPLVQCESWLKINI